MSVTVTGCLRKMVHKEYRFLSAHDFIDFTVICHCYGAVVTQDTMELTYGGGLFTRMKGRRGETDTQKGISHGSKSHFRCAYPVTSLFHSILPPTHSITLRLPPAGGHR